MIWDFFSSPSLEYFIYPVVLKRKEQLTVVCRRFGQCWAAAAAGTLGTRTGLNSFSAHPSLSLELPHSSIPHKGAEGKKNKKTSQVFTPLLCKHCWKIFCVLKVRSTEDGNPIKNQGSLLGNPKLHWVPSQTLRFLLGSPQGFQVHLEPQGFQEHHPQLNFFGLFFFFLPSEPPNTSSPSQTMADFFFFSLAGCRVLALLQLHSANPGLSRPSAESIQLKNLECSAGWEVLLEKWHFPNPNPPFCLVNSGAKNNWMFPSIGIDQPWMQPAFFVHILQETFRARATKQKSWMHLKFASVDSHSGSLKNNWNSFVFECPLGWLLWAWDLDVSVLSEPTRAAQFFWW